MVVYSSKVLHIDVWFTGLIKLSHLGISALTTIIMSGLQGNKCFIRGMLIYEDINITIDLVSPKFFVLTERY